MRLVRRALRSLILVKIEPETGALVFAQELDRPMAPTDHLIRVDRAVYDDLARDRERIETLLAPFLESAYVHVENQDS
jgi:hypothetical protein